MIATFLFCRFVTNLEYNASSNSAGCDIGAIQCYIHVRVYVAIKIHISQDDQVAMHGH